MLVWWTCTVATAVGSCPFSLHWDGFKPDYARLPVQIILSLTGYRYTDTIDIDAFDPSIASGTGTPSHGGFYYYEVLELIDGIIKQGSVVGLDLVEVAPDYDLTNSTSTLAAQLLMNTIGRILHHKK